MTWRDIVITGLLAFGVAACATTPPTRYLTLVALPPAGLQDRTGVGLTLTPPTVRWPAALDRLEVAQPGGDVEVTVAELTRWSAAPARLAAAALTQDLVARLPGLSIAPSFESAAPDAATVEVEVEAIDARPDGYGLLAAVTITRGGAAPLRRLVALHAAGTHNADGEAHALSGLIAAIADQIAGDLSIGFIAVPPASDPNANRRPTP